MMKPATQALADRQEDDTLSAFVDGELSDEQARLVLRRLDDDALERLHTYLAVGDALRGLHAGHTAPDLTARVMSALENEPTVLAPMRRTSDRRPALWLAAAAVGAISWGLWDNLPNAQAPLPIAARSAPENVDVQPYLAAHQDFAQAVIAPAEMNFTQVSLAEAHP